MALPASPDGSANFTVLYTAQFGVPRAGSKLFLPLGQIMDGWADIPHQFRALVPAAA